MAAALIGGLVCVPSALSAAPANDHFANAQVLSGESGTVPGTNVDATKEAGEPNHAGDPGGASVWFTWTAPRSGVLVLDTCDSNFDTLLGVYIGDSVDSLAVVASNDDACNEQSGLELDVVAGTPYRIAVDGFGGVTGAIALFYGMAPTNDDFASAAQMPGASGSISGSTFLASHEFGEPSHVGQLGTGSVWYQWLPPASGRASIDTCGSASNTLLAVYVGDSVSSLTPVVSNDDACGEASAVAFSFRQGFTYRIVVDGRSDFVQFTLNWSVRPDNLSPPTITGTAVEGSRLQGSVGFWQGQTNISSVWESCVPGTSDCSALGPSSSSARPTLVVPWTATGRQIRLVVTAQGPGGQTTVVSAPTATVPIPLPTVRVPPSISGAFARVGQTLTANEGVWDFGNWPRWSTTFLWQRCNYEATDCRDLGPAGGAARSYRIVAADRGWTIRVVVTMVNAGGARSEPSFPTEVVAGPPTVLRCRVPRLVGKTLTTARRSLARAKCRVGVVRRVWSARKVGVIVAQRPRAGTRLRAGGRVNVVLSKGRRR